MLVLNTKIVFSLLSPLAVLIAPQIVSAQGQIVFPGGAKIEWGGHPAHRYEPNNAANRGNHQIEKQLNHLDKLSEGGFTMNTGGGKSAIRLNGPSLMPILLTMAMEDIL